MKKVAYMSVHNGAEFVEYSIRSVIKHVDRFIVLEGAWGENIIVNNKPRSTDGTLEILARLQKEFLNLEVYHINAREQCEQRSKVFDYLDEECWLWLVDHDEVYEFVGLINLFEKLQNATGESIKINSLTFINDFNHYVEIAWPRLFHFVPGHKYVFRTPNHVLRDGVELVEESFENEVAYFHYSYCHKSERFLEKGRERMYRHGQFKWYLEDGKVVSPGVNIRKFEGEHPPIMDSHPLHPRNLAKSP